MDSITTHFLAHLWRGGEFAYWYGIDEKRTFFNERTQRDEPCKTSYWFRAARPVPLPTCPTLHVYFGVNPSSVQRKRWERAIIPTVAAINCLFGEIDAKDFSDGMDGVRAHVAQLDPQPSVTIFSGGGLHCYWLLHAPYVLNDTNREPTKALLYRWVDRVKSDPASKDLCRVLRVPGTRNIKASYGPNFPLVSFETCDMGALFDMGELAALAPAKPRAERLAPAVSSSPSATWADKVAEVRTAPAGQLHMTLRRVSCNAGWYVAHGAITEGEATRALTDAAEAAGAIDMSNVIKTIESGIEKGRGFYAQGRRLNETWATPDVSVGEWAPPRDVRITSW